MQSSHVTYRYVSLLIACCLSIGTAPLHALDALQPVVTIMPAAPTTLDNIQVIAEYPLGPYVETKSHTISGNVVSVRFVQDGWDFSPNPPHAATETVGRLAPGTYQFVVTSTLPSATTPSVQEFAIVVSSVAVPIGRGAYVVLALLLLVLGMTFKAAKR